MWMVMGLTFLTSADESNNSASIVSRIDEVQQLFKE
jgi:hypothetical protein